MPMSLCLLELVPNGQHPAPVSWLASSWCQIAAGGEADSSVGTGGREFHLWSSHFAASFRVHVAESRRGLGQSDNPRHASKGPSSAFRSQLDSNMNPCGQVSTTPAGTAASDPGFGLDHKPHRLPVARFAVRLPPSARRAAETLQKSSAAAC